MLSIGVIILAVLVGVVFGVIFQRGRLCMNSALRDPLVFKDFKMIKAVGLILCLEMVLFALLYLLNLVPYGGKPLALVPQIIGGIVFGLGMVLAGGCASGTTYKVGEGLMLSLLALIGLTVGAISTGSGVLLQVKTWIYTLGPAQESVFIGGTGTNTRAFIALAIGVVGTLLFVFFAIGPEMKKKKEKINIGFKGAWTWWITAIAFAVVNSVFYVLGSKIEGTGHTYGLAITKGWMGFSNWLSTSAGGDALGWVTWVVLGIILGAFVSAKIAGEFKMSIPRDPWKVVLSLLGGFLMGFGAVTGQGCNVTHVLSGIPLLSVGSMVGGFSILIGSWIMAYFMFVLPMKKAEKE